MTLERQQRPVTRRAKHREYSSLMTRRLSFNGIQMTTGQSPQDLARTGFFYAGHKNFVRCFCCGILITNWQRGQDPETVHRTKSPHCSFLSDPPVPTDYVNTPAINPIGQPEIEQLSDDICRRLAIDKGYDLERVQRAYQLCKQASSDERAVDINEVTNMLLEMEINANNQSRESAPTQHQDTTDSMQERTPSYINRIEREVRHLRESSKCKICMDKSANTLTMPCGHFTSCEHCSNSVTHCPQCRARITSRIRVYT